MSLLDRLAWLYATGCGVGLAPKAPGTFGSLLGPLLVAGWQSLSRPIHEGVIVALAGVLLGVAAAQRVARRCGLEDPGCVVCDEIAVLPAVVQNALDRAVKERDVSALRNGEPVIGNVGSKHRA